MMHSDSESIPVFLVGPVRSGSTFLRLMLDSHPGITNPGECDFLFDCVDDEGRFPGMPHYHDWLSANRIFLAKGLRINTSLSYADLMLSFIEQFCQAGNRLVMNVHRHFHRVPFVFPAAKYIHLLRDPRDVARSCIGMGWAGHVYFGVDIWMEAESSWDQLKIHLRPEQYIEIKYENLLDDVENGLDEICRFIGLEYSPAMLNYSSNSSYAKPDKNLSYQWKQKYSTRELQLVEGKVGKMLLDRGYEPSGHVSDTPGVMEEIKLGISNKVHKLRFAIDRYGLWLYLKNQIARRFKFARAAMESQKMMNRIDERHLK